MTRFYQSSAWQRARAKAMARAGFRSSASGKLVTGKGKAIVDHIRPLKDAPHLALDQANLRVLTPAEHNARHGHSRSACDVRGMPLAPDHPWNRKAK
jgi:5-methylcytosine-specific restriction endonuclease McrA